VSLLWADQLTILMCPNRLLVAHRPRGLRAGSMTTTVEPVPASSQGTASWEPAAAKLEALFATNPQWREASLRIILSNHFVRYALVPWNDHLSSEQEHLLFARRHFAQTHGPAAKSWAIRISLDQPGESHVASALDQALMDRLTLAAEASHLKLASVEPLLMTAFNRCLQDFREETQWFVTVETGMLCGVLLGRDRWIALRRWRIQDDWVSELPLWLSREQMIGEDSASASTVYLLAPPRAGTDSITLQAPVKFLGRNGGHGTRSRMTNKGMSTVEEADYFSCIL
jgi:hypothetical protein